jgi:hypothetical protein
MTGKRARSKAAATSRAAPGRQANVAIMKANAELLKAGQAPVGWLARGRPADCPACSMHTAARGRRGPSQSRDATLIMHGINESPLPRATRRGAFLGAGHFAAPPLPALAPCSPACRQR